MVQTPSDQAITFIKAHLRKLSVCECGYPLLREDISLGTEYNIIPEFKQTIGILCGGCNVLKKHLCVFARRPGDKGGFLPCEAFVIHADDL